jgi:hypothetical protein
MKNFTPPTKTASKTPMKKAWLLAFLIFIIHHSTFIIAEAQTTLASGVVNKYQPVSAVAGSTITLSGTATGATHTFAAGDRVLLVQMTGLTSANGGKFEFVTLAAGTTASSLVTTTPITRAYTPATEKVQAIWVPYDATSITVPAGGISALKWNGTTGGIVAILTPGTLTLNGTINADGAGFRFADGTNTINGTDIYYGGGGGGSIGDGGGGGGGYGSPGKGAGLVNYNAFKVYSLVNATNGNLNGGDKRVGAQGPIANPQIYPFDGGSGGGAGVGGAGAGGSAGPHGAGAGGAAGYGGGGNGGNSSGGLTTAGKGTSSVALDTDGTTGYDGYRIAGGGGGANRFVGGSGGGVGTDAVGKSGTNGGIAIKLIDSEGGNGGGTTPIAYNQYQYCDGSFNCPDPRIWMAGGGQGITQGGGIVMVNAGNVIANTKTISANGDVGRAGVVGLYGIYGGGFGGGGGGLVVINTQSVSNGPLSLCAKGGQGGAGVANSEGTGGGGAGGGGLVWVTDPLGGVGRNNASGTLPTIDNMIFCIDGGASSIAAANQKSGTFTGVGGAGGTGAVLANNPCGVFGACITPCGSPDCLGSSIKKN